LTVILFLYPNAIFVTTVPPNDPQSVIRLKERQKAFTTLCSDSDKLISTCNHEVTNNRQAFFGRYAIQHNDILHSGIQQADIQHNDIQHNGSYLH